MKPIRPHPDHHELHGVTVAVDTRGPHIYVGRCHTIDDTRIYLVDVDVHEGGEGGTSKRDWLARIGRFGHWKKVDRLALDLADVAWMDTLGNIAEQGPPEACS